MEYDPAVAARFRQLREQAERAGANPQVGEAEVTAFAAAFHQLMADSGLAEELERQRLARRYRWPRGRAVDIPPRTDLFRWIRGRYP